LPAGPAGIGATVWKVHATATYMTWFYPFLLLLPGHAHRQR